MLKYAIKRLFQMLVVLAVVTVLVFFMTNFLSDPIEAIVDIQTATEADIQAVREQLGLNDPILVQFGRFVSGILKGDFGTSYVYKTPVLDLIFQRVPATAEIVLFTAILTLLIAIPLGVIAGANPQTKLSKGIMAGSIFGISLPSFWMGMMLIYVFSVSLQILPASGRAAAGPGGFSFLTPGGWKNLIMPVLTLALGYSATILRVTRAGIQENMKQDYVKFARAKGVSRRNVLFHHALKNALVPVVTVFGLNIGHMFAFTTVTETIFAWPGVGKLLIDSILRNDRPIIVAYLILVSAMFVVINFIVDIIYMLVDPRIELR